MTIQLVQDCGRSVRLTTPAFTTQQMEIITLIGLVDSILADFPNEEVTANLYSARHHLARAVKAVTA